LHALSPEERRARFFANDRAEDTRSVAERDRDRLLYSDEFRRLGGVTQVVHVAEGHSYHNRLTHSIKVAQVARRLAERLIRTHRELATRHELDPSVAEAAALAHDLGHPPFGHIAEDELDEAVRGAGLGEGYEGNAQTFRIVASLSVRRPNFRGLNLTRACLCAILKYPWLRKPGKRKFGAYESEKDQFEFARKEFGADESQSVDAAIMDWADDVAYSVHDVEDFYQVGLVPLDRLFRGAESDTADPEFSRFLKKEIDRRISSGAATEAQRAELETEARTLFKDIHGTLNPVLDEPFSGTIEQRAWLHEFGSALIGRYLRDVTLEEQEGRLRLRIPEKVRRDVGWFKELMRHYVFTHTALAAQQVGQRRVVRDLFDAFLMAIKEAKRSAIIPAPFRPLVEKARSDGTPLMFPRLTADIVASLTEQQALFLHKRLAGLDPGTVIDVIVR
jgi:dGTPase